MYVKTSFNKEAAKGLHRSYTGAAQGSRRSPRRSSASKNKAAGHRRQAFYPGEKAAGAFSSPTFFTSSVLSPFAGFFLPLRKTGISRKEGSPLSSTGDEQLCLHKNQPVFLLFLCKNTFPRGRRQQPGRETALFSLRKGWFRRVSIKTGLFFPGNRPIFSVKSEKRPSEKAVFPSFTQNSLKTFLYFV